MAKQTEKDTIKLRGKTFSLRWRVPARYREVERRERVWVSLKTADASEARMRAPAAKADLIDAWERALGRQEDETVTGRFARLVEIAQRLGHHHKTIAEVAEGPIDDLVARIETLQKLPAPSDDTVAAVLGSGSKQQVMLSELVAHVEALPKTQKENIYKNSEQMVRWRQARDRAVSNLRAAMKAKTGSDDKPVRDLTSDDAWLHHDAWEARLNANEIDAETANKDFGYIGGLLRRFYASIKTPNPKPYAGISLKDIHKVQTRKLELPADWMETTLFDPEKLAGLNEEARDILIIAAEVGCRQSEIHDLPPEAFRLDEPIPHLLIRNEEPEILADGSRRGGRQIKNTHSTREVALVGYALDAARRRARDGFPRYGGKRTFSAAANKFLRENELLPKPPKPNTKYTVGGTRHAFESRMKAASLHSDDRGEMMGHSVKSERKRELYGDGMPLEVKHLIAQMISFGDAVSPEERKAARRELARRGLFK